MADIADTIQEREGSDLEKKMSQEDYTIYERMGSFVFDKTKKTATGIVYFGGLYATFGINPLITSVGFMLGESIVKTKNDEKIEGKKLKNEAYVGGAMGVFLHYFFSAVSGISTLPLKVAYTLASIPVFNFLHAGVDHVVNKYKPIEFYETVITRPYSLVKETYKESIQPRWIPSIKTVFTKPFPLVFPIGVIANTLAPYGITGKMLGALGLSTIYRSITAESPKKDKVESKNNNFAGQPALA